MTETKEKVTPGLRLASMLLDHFLMTFLMTFIVLPGFVVKIFTSFNVNHDSSTFGFGGLVFLFALGFSAYFNKDIFSGRSPAKRILKMQVVDNNTGRAATPFKCLTRNFTIPLWPIEVVFVLINPERRLGDKIAGTRVEYAESPEKIKVDWPKFSLALLIAFGFTLLISSPIVLLDSMWKADKVAYVEGTFNEKASELTNQEFQTELQDLIKEADFRIYDQIENDDRKYISGILYFNSKDDYNNFEDSEQRISDLLTTKFPLENHVCFLKYVYKEPGSLIVRPKLYDSRKKNDG